MEQLPSAQRGRVRMRMNRKEGAHCTREPVRPKREREAS